MLCPSVHYDDKRGSLASLILVVSFSLTILATLIFLAHLSVSREQRAQESLQTLLKKDPVSAAHAALQANDHRYWAIPGHRTGSEKSWTDRVFIPGFGEFEKGRPQHPDYRSIPGIPKARLNQAEERQYQLAAAFAEAYNRVLLEAVGVENAPVTAR